MVMVSGGQDSLALLDVLSRGRLGAAGPAGLHALHVNHHLRGEESDADQALVEDVCERLGVDLTVVHRPIAKSEGNVQEVAREARRAAAGEVAAGAGCDRIALGHTADDQAETLLYRMGRYGGLAALAGMRPCDPPWVRPLLGCRREETAAYCRAQGLEFANDRGNTHPGYARTGIREKVLPAWESVLPGAVSAACRVAEVAAEAQELLGEVIAEAAARVAVKESGSSGVDAHGQLSVPGLLSLSKPRRRLLLHDYLQAHLDPAVSRASVLAVEELLGVQGSGRRALGGGWQALKEYDRLSFERAGQECGPAPPPVELSVPGEVVWGEVRISAERVAGFRAPDVSREAIVDADSLVGPLWVRAPLAGDKLHPLGSPGRRKLQDVFVDLKIPQRRRERQALVVCGERIVWVCGLVVSEHARVGRETKRFVRLAVEASVTEGGSCGRS